MCRIYTNPNRKAYLAFRKSSTCGHKLDYHIVIPTKYRTPLFTPAIAQFTRDIIVEKCENEGYALLGLSAQIDHLHLFLGLKPTDHIPHVLQKIKGFTTRMIIKEFPGHFKDRARRKVWAEGYSIESLGFKNVAQIKAYIDSQDEHHAVELQG